MNDNGRPAGDTPARRTARVILIVSALLLPSLSLIPLGGFYLWEKGWMLWWAVGALLTIAIAVILQRALLSKATHVAGQDAAPVKDTGLEYPTKRERLAWSDVRAIARNVDIDQLGSADAVIALGQRTVDAVARRMHPEKPDAVWRFTLPQALAIGERVSSRLGDFVETRVPFGDRLTVAQLLSVYGWRRYIGVAEQAYDVWRVIRMANPATAVTQEAREQLSRSLMNWGKEHVSRRIAEAFVEEVGRAAIDLYSGRLPAAGAGGLVASSQSASGADIVPPAIVVVGSDENARSQLASDLGTALAANDAQSFGTPPAVTNSHAISGAGFGRRQLTRAASGADVLVWAASATSGPTASEIDAVSELRRYFAASSGAYPPGMIVAAINAPTDGERELTSYAGDLANGLSHPGNPFDVPASAVVAVSVNGPGRAADLQRLAAIVMRSVVETRAARQSMQSRAADRKGLWASAGQAASAVGGLAGALLKPRAGEGDR